ncbi:hypothetical protein [Sulfurospirillum arcachonense]|uniref:hypothetical protein n=1 Tax=Sulfurospirillum arcachonense TaxID=57666 RepID=UPI00046A3B9B|nr:hypothetical protein [Sulfurospirillum arcachonense]
MKNFFKKLFKLSNVPDVDHPFFGKMLYAEGYWEVSELTFNQYSNLGITVNASENDPFEPHENFTKSILSNLDETIQKLKPKISKEFESFLQKPVPDNFFDEFTLVGLSTPENGDTNNDWEISFDCKSDQNHMFTVYFENGVASEVSVDG